MYDKIFKVDEQLQVFAWLSGVLTNLKPEKQYKIELKEHHKKRSLSANAYLWVLCDKLAEELNKNDVVVNTKESIYRKAIREYGLFYDDEVIPEQVDRRKKAWSMIGIGWFSERVDFSADGEKEVLRFYYGSSMYSTKQMSNLLQGVIQDCQALDIETKTPDEIAEMMSLWESQKEVVK